MREAAAARKYAGAVELYASTDLPLRKVAEMCGVSAFGLSAHIGRHHRPLLLARYGLDPAGPDADVMKVRPPKGQSLKTHLKYKEAIEACGDIAYIEYNVAQIARMFELDGPALASQLRTHYPDIIPMRELTRQRLGIADNAPRGVRPTSEEEYGEALKMYRDTDMTIPAVAEKCGVSKSGFGQFMRFYHKDVIAEKAARRRNARKERGMRRAGKLSGNGRLYGPKPSTVELYATALELYTTTGLTVEMIVEQTGVSAEGFRGYIHQWHRDDKPTRSSLKPVAQKYAPAIESLRSNPRPLTEVAAEFGLSADPFRVYLKAHEPELAKALGMTRLANGKVVKRSSSQKYGEAIREYASTPESLTTIAERHGLVYKSVLGFMLRHCPEERESHMKIVEQAKKSARL